MKIRSIKVCNKACSILLHAVPYSSTAFQGICIDYYKLHISRGIDNNKTVIDHTCIRSSFSLKSSVHVASDEPIPVDAIALWTRGRFSRMSLFQRAIHCPYHGSCRYPFESKELLRYRFKRNSIADITILISG